MRMLLAVPLLLAMLAGPAVAQELRGHGGPVRAVAVAPDGRTAMTGSFDQSSILWQLDTGTAIAVLRGHDEAVNAVVALPDGRFASGGGDGRIAIWRGGPQPERSIVAHRGPIAALAVSADGRTIASAAWDGTARLTPLGNVEARVLEGHQGNVNGVAFAPDGSIVTAGYDATLRIWPSDGGTPLVVTLPTPLNAVHVAPDGEIVVAGADGKVRILSPKGDVLAALDVAPTPVIALALSRNGTRIVAGGLRGEVAIIDRASRRVEANLVGPGLPVWSLAFTPDGREILSGGADRIVRRWDARSGQHLGAVVPQRGEDVLASFKGERGAEVFRACAACHTLTPDDGNRAGPTLHGIFGRRIGSLPDYAYSTALPKLDIVWTPETVAKLFEVGPNTYTPGTKMPEQTIPRAEDRQALVDFLAKATAPKP